MVTNWGTTVVYDTCPDGTNVYDGTLEVKSDTNIAVTKLVREADSNIYEPVPSSFYNPDTLVDGTYNLLIRAFPSNGWDIGDYVLSYQAGLI